MVQLYFISYVPVDSVQCRQDRFKGHTPPPSCRVMPARTELAYGASATVSSAYGSR